MLYCYDCGSNSVSNEICNECGSKKVFDDEEENLREKILESILIKK